MNKWIYIPILVLILSSCSKEIPSIEDPVNAPTVSAVPSNFIQKIIIENFTQTTAGQCTKANLTLDSLIRFNPDRVYGVSFHVDDIMSDASLILGFSGRNYYDSIFNPSGIYPTGMVNRRINNLADISPDQWATKVFTGVSQAPSCGIALEAEQMSGSTLNLIVHVGFSENMSGQYRIHAYIVENNIQNFDPLYDQLNDFSFEGITPDTSLSLYALNDTIRQYNHKYIHKKVVTPAGVEGSIIPEALMTKGNKYVTSFDVDFSGINVSNSYIIVFVDKHATDINGHWIENVQKVAFGESKDWN